MEKAVFYLDRLDADEQLPAAAAAEAEEEPTEALELEEAPTVGRAMAGEEPPPPDVKDEEPDLLRHCQTMRFVARGWKEGKCGRVPSAGDVRSVDIEIQAFQAWAVESPDAGRELRKARCEQLSRAVLAHT